VQAQPQPQGVLYTKEQAAQILGIGLDALRKRLDRGVSVVRVNINGQDLVRFV
jgi:DNA-directed RNA polymerase specialized sigma24 family protein